jgi:hypothetical protein
MMESLCEMVDTRYARYIAQTMPLGSESKADMDDLSGEASTANLSNTSNHIFSPEPTKQREESFSELLNASSIGSPQNVTGSRLQRQLEQLVGLRGERRTPSPLPSRTFDRDSVCCPCNTRWYSDEV